MSYENMVPLTQDLTEESHKLDIIRGLEGVIRIDKDIADGVTLAEGQWAVLKDDDTLDVPAATPVANTYPIWAGNADGRSDVHATGKATMLQGGRFIYRTTMFDASLASASVGTAITVKASGLPTAQAGTEVVLARVFKMAANGIIEIEVL